MAALEKKFVINFVPELQFHLFLFSHNWKFGFWRQKLDGSTSFLEAKTFLEVSLDCLT
jgi:hypothetical protein